MIDTDHKFLKPILPQPPEECRALCALCDVKWKFVVGRGANTWELHVIRYGDYSGPPERFARIIQVTDYESWRELVDWLVSKRDEQPDQAI